MPKMGPFYSWLDETLLSKLLTSNSPKGGAQKPRTSHMELPEIAIVITDYHMPLCPPPSQGTTMHQQASFAKLAYRIKKCLTQFELLLVEMGTVEPWADLPAHIAPRPGRADASPCR